MDKEINFNEVRTQYNVAKKDNSNRTPIISSNTLDMRSFMNHPTGFHDPSGILNVS